MYIGNRCALARPKSEVVRWKVGGSLPVRSGGHFWALVFFPAQKTMCVALDNMNSSSRAGFFLRQAFHPAMAGKKDKRKISAPVRPLAETPLKFW